MTKFTSKAKRTSAATKKDVLAMEERLVQMGEGLDTFISNSMDRLPQQQRAYIEPIRETLELLSVMAMGPLFANPLPKNKADLHQRILKSQDVFQQFLQVSKLPSEAQQFFSSIYEQTSRRVEYQIAFGTDPALGGPALN